MQKDESSRSERVGLLFHYLRATDFPKIARRYFALNLYDGVLTMMGFILGYYMVGGRNPEEIVGAGIAASIAMGLSGFVGAFITELAERGKELEELEKTMFKDLGNTIVSETHKIAAFFIALIDGAAPAIGALLLSTPLMRPFIDYLEYDIAIKLSMGMGLALLFALGSFLGSTSLKSSIAYGSLMLLAGLVLALITVFLGGVV